MTSILSPPRLQPALLEQPARSAGSMAIHLPVRPVPATRLQEDCAVAAALARSSPRKRRADRVAIDPVGERLAHERAAKSGVTTRADPEVEVLPPGRTDGRGLWSGSAGAREHAECRLTPSRHRRSSMRRHLRRRPSGSGGGRSDDDPLEIRRVRPPVTRVAHERHLPAPLPPRDEEGPAPDRRAGPGVVDPVGPDLLRSDAGQRVPRQHDLEEKERQSARGARRRLGRLRAERAGGGTLAWTPDRGRCSRIALSVKTKSRAVTGMPSLQRASGRIA